MNLKSAKCSEVRIHIVVKNPGHAESGCVKLVVNGKEIEGNYVPEEIMTEQTEIEMYMS